MRILLPCIALAAAVTMTGLAFPMAAAAQSRDEIVSDVGEVALTPLSDLNLRGNRVPEILAEIDSPYQAIEDRTCRGIGTLVTALDEALGEDADVALAETDGERDREIARNTVGSTLSGLILPFRGLVRTVSGAASRERRNRELHVRGVARRAYLKGVGQMLNCAYPAAPLSSE